MTDILCATLSSVDSTEWNVGGGRMVYNLTKYVYGLDKCDATCHLHTPTGVKKLYKITDCS